MRECQVVWDWKSKHRGVEIDRRGEATTVVWPADLPAFLGAPREKLNETVILRHLKALKTRGLLICYTGTLQYSVKVGDEVRRAYVFACAPDDVPRIEIERSADTGGTGRLLKAGTW